MPFVSLHDWPGHRIHPQSHKISSSSSGLMSGSSKPGGARGGGFFGFCFFGSGGGAILMGGTYITQCNRQSNAMRTASSAKMTARCFDDVGGGLAIALFDFAGRISDGRGLLLGVGGFCFDGDGWLLRRRAGDCDARARGGIVVSQFVTARGVVFDHYQNKSINAELLALLGRAPCWAPSEVPRSSDELLQAIRPSAT